MTLVEFLTARLDEDEAAAREAAGWASSGRERASGEWHREGVNSVVDADGRLVVYGDGPSPADAEAGHIARHDPARVLREVEAKRAIVADHDGTHECPREGDGAGWWDGEPCDVLRHLAAVYSDHPDYDEEWRP